MPAISPGGVSHGALADEIRSILDGSVRTIHPLFVNQLNGGFEVTSWIGNVVGAILNSTMATFEVSPVLTVIEKRLVSELLAVLGFDHGEGIMVTGGSNASLLAMLCARTNHDQSIWRAGYAHARARRSVGLTNR